MSGRNQKSTKWHATRKCFESKGDLLEGAQVQVQGSIPSLGPLPIVAPVMDLLSHWVLRRACVNFGTPTQL